jgi:hypothetical protein
MWRPPVLALEQQHLLAHEGDLHVLGPIAMAARRDEVEQQGEQVQTTRPDRGASLRQ